MLIFGITLGMIGKVLLGVTVIRVHSHLAKEHKVDDDVVNQIHLEKILGTFAILLILIGYLLEIYYLIQNG